MLGLIGEIGLEGDHRVASGIFGTRGNGATERIERAIIADVLRAAKDRERHHVGVGRERLDGGVGAPVVVDQHLVLARVLLEHPADAPEQDADSFSFVVSGDADIQHQGPRRGVYGVARRKLETLPTASHPSYTPME
jgi:hypothetical protein